MWILISTVFHVHKVKQGYIDTCNYVFPRKNSKRLNLWLPNMVHTMILRNLGKVQGHRERVADHRNKNMSNWV